MFTTLFLGLIASAATPDGHHHRLTVQHAGAPLTVDYRARIDLKTRQIGMAPPTRHGVVRCTWTARIAVERSLAGHAGSSRLIDQDLTLKGSETGNCREARKLIDRALAKRADEVQAHMVAVAERDRSVLLAELAAAAPNPS